MSLRFHAEAEDDVLAGFTWYAQQQDGLGEAFIEAVDVVARRLSSRLVHRSLRGYEALGVKIASMHRFPYRLLYCLEGDAIIVFAVAHNRRHPDFWAHRLAG